MRPRLSSSTLGGFVPAVVTPFSASGEIIAEDFLAIVDHMIAIGAKGICVAGDNGESWALSPEERGLLTRLAVEKVAGRVPVVMGATAPSASQTIAYARIAEDAGADAVLVMPQTYVLKATRDELMLRFETLGRATSLPIVLYNSPRRAGIDLSVSDIEALLDVAPVIGIKESSRDFFKHTHLLQRLGRQIAVMIGPSHFILPGIALGAAGFIATGPELLGADAARIVDVGCDRPGEEYARLHNRLALAYEALMATGTWPSALKAALVELGLPAGVPRDPVLPLDEHNLGRIRAMLRDIAALPADAVTA